MYLLLTGRPDGYFLTHRKAVSDLMINSLECLHLVHGYRLGGADAGGRRARL